MNVSPLNRFAFSTFDVLKEQSQGLLSNQQKKVALVAIVLFAIIALISWTAFICWFNAKLAVEGEEFTKDLQQRGIIDDGFSVEDVAKIYQHAGADKDLYRKVIGDTGFLKDPQAYLKRWSAYKGTSELKEAKTYHDRIYQKAENVAHTKSQEFCRYVKVVLDTGILVDSKGYLKQWADERGGTEEKRLPEDEARAFFENEL